MKIPSPLRRTIALCALGALSTPLALAFDMPGAADMFDSASVTSNIAEKFDRSLEQLLRDQFNDARAAFMAARLDYDWFAAEEAARKARLSSEGSHDDFLMGLADLLVGTALSQQSRYIEAVPILERARQELGKQRGPADVHTLWSVARLEEIRLRQGRLAECLALARTLPDRATGDDSKEELLAAMLDARHWPALAAIQLGRFKEAEDLIGSMRVATERSRDKIILRERAKALELLAMLRHNKGRSDEALAAAREVLELRRKTDPDSGSVATGSVFLANLLIAHGHPEEAWPLAESAAALAERTLGPQDITTGKARQLRASYYSKKGDTRRAKADLNSALAIFRAADARPERVVTARQLARLLAAQGEHEAAVERYLEALSNIDALFAATRGIDESARRHFLDRYLPYYHEVVSYLIGLNARDTGQRYARTALEVVSRTQSRIFTELLRQALAGRSAGDAPFRALLADKDADKRRLDALNERLARLPKPKDDPILARRVSSMADDIRSQMAKAGSALESTEKRLWRAYPRYMELAEPRPVSVESLQKQSLRTGETLLVYYLQANQITLFVVQPNRFLLRVVDQSTDEVASRIRRVRRAMSFNERLDPADLHRLYELLLLPVADALPDHGHVTVVGDGPIHALPLEMLVANWDASQQAGYQQARQRGDDAYAGLDYAGKHLRFTYLPSLAALTAIREAEHGSGKYRLELVSFADPVFDRVNSTSVQTRRGVQLARLKETEEEARDIAAILDGKSRLFLRDAAQEGVVKQLGPGQARYLHFATHGLLGGEFLRVKSEHVSEVSTGIADRNLSIVEEDEVAVPVAQGAESADAQPALVLSLFGDMRGEDGLLTMAEVIDSLRTDAELVVLSACNTAGEGGSPGGGEGFAGMTRGFMYAGAKGLYVSHWSVESLATRDLMVEAFKRIKAGAKPVDALAEAREVIRAEPGRGNPVFWAPFVYVGF